MSIWIVIFLSLFWKRCDIKHCLAMKDAMTENSGELCMLRRKYIKLGDPKTPTKSVAILWTIKSNAALLVLLQMYSEVCRVLHRVFLTSTQMIIWTDFTFPQGIYRIEDPTEEEQIFCESQSGPACFTDADNKGCVTKVGQDITSYSENSLIRPSFRPLLSFKFNPFLAH